MCTMQLSNTISTYPASISAILFSSIHILFIMALLKFNENVWIFTVLVYPASISAILFLYPASF